MTSANFNNIPAQVATASSDEIKKQTGNAESGEVIFNFSPENQQAINVTVGETVKLLEEEAKNSTGGLFGKAYNLFTSKDNKLNREVKEVKEVYNNALKNDGNIDVNELKQIEKEYNEATERLGNYKEGRKFAADVTSTGLAIGASVALTAATGGLGTVAGVALVSSGAALTKVGSKEVMLGDDYNAIGKEGFTDGLFTGLGAGTGVVLGKVTAASSLLTKIETKVAHGLGNSGTRYLASDILQ
jgi:hypothetical protein